MPLAHCAMEGSLALVTLDNPPVNALDPATREALLEVFGELYARAEEVGSVILRGAGTKAFAAGADIRSFLELDREAALKRLARSREINAAIENFPRPVIAAIDGHCLGGGLELALCCDIRYASERSTFGFPEVNLGLIPGNGGTQRARRHLSSGRVRELMYTGEFLTAREALECGLVERVTPAEGLLDKALATASRIATRGPLAVSSLKALLNATEDLPLEEGLNAEAVSWSRLAGTGEMREGVRAFLEKRPPSFSSR